MHEITDNKSNLWRHILIVSGLVIFLIVAAAWSYAWFRARDIAMAHFDGWLAAEARAGRIHECNNRKSGGYPFYITVSCDAPVFQLSDKIDEAVVRFSSLKIIGRSYSPYVLIAELGGPLTLTQNAKVLFSADFKKARASLQHDWSRIERLSLAGENVILYLPQASAHVSAAHAELHLRPSLQGASLQAQNFDLALEARRVVTAGSLADQPTDLTLAGTLHDWPLWRETPTATLDAWRQSGGRMEIQELRLLRNGGVFFAAGETSFNESHRAEGRFTATFVNSPALLRGLIMQGDNDAGAMFGPLLLMLGKQVEFEGQRATALQLKINNGVLSLGNMVLAEFPPLY